MLAKHIDGFKGYCDVAAVPKVHQRFLCFQMQNIQWLRHLLSGRAQSRPDDWFFVPNTSRLRSKWHCIIIEYESWITF